MFVRLILVGAALMPFIGHATVKTSQNLYTKVATCQVKNEAGQSFVILENREFYADSLNPRKVGVPIALIENKGNTNGLIDISSRNDVIKLHGKRFQEILFIEGQAHIPRILSTPVTGEIKMMIGTDNSVVAPDSSINHIIFTIQGQTEVRELICVDARS